VTQTFTLKGEPRPVRDDVLGAMDAALGALGGELLHAIDPARIMSFTDGGPPVWSVGLVPVGGPRPYTLLLTYGFSHVFSPEPSREGIGHEFSLAVPQGCPVQPWGVALLRHLSRYVLSSGNDLLVGDVMPCHAPITRIPFPPAHHAALPDTSVDSVVVVPDPVLPRITTPHGDIEVRRFVGIDTAELKRLGPMPAAERSAARAKVDPLFLTDISR
jgi:hypothetical protein